ncbi:unnamed protein product [Timema podura]|uniref:C2H2-type domain-containing protein n=1 Tax=Timema podura TaxID=61482 RepID=A0ABN7NGM4_TIMPD|nr:unnamed protein product [Timema podura]
MKLHTSKDVKCTVEGIHTLQQHMKLHTGKDVKCTVEGCIFECRSRAELSLHLTVHSEERPFHCDDCEYSAKTKSQLARVMVQGVHEVAEKACNEDGKGNNHKEENDRDEIWRKNTIDTKEELEGTDSSKYVDKRRVLETKEEKLHNLIHEGVKPHRCPHCSFSSRLISQLRRHLRLHTGARPYRCPYCDYTCNILVVMRKVEFRKVCPHLRGGRLGNRLGKNLNTPDRDVLDDSTTEVGYILMENLRKHVLSTNRHPGKKLYECKFCDESSTRFSTNLAKQFRAHLVSVHEAMFHTPSVASTYIAGIYDAHLDPMHIENPIPLQPRWKRGKKKACAEASSSGHFLENPDEAPDEPMSQAELSPPDRTQASSTRDAPSSLMRHNTCVDLSIQESNPGHILPMVVVAADNTADGVIYIELPASPDGYCGSERSATTLFHGGTFLSDFRDRRTPGGAEVTVGREEVSAEDPVLVIRHPDHQEERNDMLGFVREDVRTVVVEENDVYRRGIVNEEGMTVITVPSCSGDYLQMAHLVAHEEMRLKDTLKEDQQNEGKEQSYFVVLQGDS